MISVEGAIEFFTNRIRVNPNDAFSFAMRTLRHDKSEIDAALRDYDQTIALDPKSAFAHAG